MKRLLAAAVLGFVLVEPGATLARAAITAEQVRDAINKGVGYLKETQIKEGPNAGSWGNWIGQPHGVSALCTLALLNAGVEPGDDCIQRALTHLRKVRPESTYVVSLQTMVLCRAEPNKDLLLINRNVKWLEKTQLTEGGNRGSWSYPGRLGDNSNSQFALLALHEAERAGATVNPQTWRWAKGYWESCQNIDGAWGYYKAGQGLPMGAGGTGSMTCAGLTSLIIASDRAQPPDAAVVEGQIKCCLQRDGKDDGNIDRGVQWLTDHFSVVRNPGPTSNQWLLYYLYGLERVGRMTARRTFGDHNWYYEGAEFLIGRQDNMSGFWVGVGHSETNPQIATSFALLFLAKGRWPVLIAKLQHQPSPEAAKDWNRHRSDVANLTRYVESQWKRDLVWQVIDARKAKVEELTEMPVIYMCGSVSPLPATRAEQKQLAQKLRDYIDRGGFLFAEGSCGGTGFDQGFRNLMAQVFPEPEYKLQLLDASHPIWSAEEKVRQLRRLEGIDFGCRTSVVYAPPFPLEKPQPSLSVLWELSRPGREATYPPAIQAQIQDGLAIGRNVLAYATNRELDSKEKFFAAQAEIQPKGKFERGRLYLAKLRHPGGCNSAPRALVNLVEAANQQLKIRATAREELLDLTDDTLFDYHLVLMHGRTAFRLTEAERGRLKAYLERGGMLFADSICASEAFNQSFRREMAAIFPDRKLERIPVTDPLLTKTYGGSDLKTVSRRDPQSRRNGEPMQAAVREVPPDLEGIKFQDRWGVVFSPYDVSCALEHRDTLECRGYLRADAAKIGLNVILYSLQQ